MSKKVRMTGKTTQQPQNQNRFTVEQEIERLKIREEIEKLKAKNCRNERHFKLKKQKIDRRISDLQNRHDHPNTEESKGGLFGLFKKH